ncbi:MAG: hypothetical protein N4A36_00360 [Candidatus Gracilibacteria bacterium]|jgi:hypothetical protein|nr:hypothetical protein [Candidatus Gracilibacteria bacterium]
MNEALKGRVTPDDAIVKAEAAPPKPMFAETAPPEPMFAEVAHPIGITSAAVMDVVQRGSLKAISVYGVDANTEIKGSIGAHAKLMNEARGEVDRDLRELFLRFISPEERETDTVFDEKIGKLVEIEILFGKNEGADLSRGLNQALSNLDLIDAFLDIVENQYLGQLTRGISNKKLRHLDEWDLYEKANFRKNLMYKVLYAFSMLTNDEKDFSPERLHTVKGILKRDIVGIMDGVFYRNSDEIREIDPDGIFKCDFDYIMMNVFSSIDTKILKKLRKKYPYASFPGHLDQNY